MARRALLPLLSVLLVSCRGGGAPAHATFRDGQWVWSAADSALLAASVRGGASLTAGVWVSTVRPAVPGDSLAQTLALPPSAAGLAPIAAVAFHAWWADHSDRVTADQLDRRLRTLLDLLSRSGATVTEVQLDYDCPVRLLPRWARVLHRLRHSSLEGREVWITSLLAHQRDPAFGRRLRGAVDGQILQLFDTGDRAAGARLDDLERRLVRQGLPFRVGLGAFERRLPGGGLTDHVAWFGAVRELRTWPGFRGLWVFPAGRPYQRLVREAS